MATAVTMSGAPGHEAAADDVAPTPRPLRPRAVYRLDSRPASPGGGEATSVRCEDVKQQRHWSRVGIGTMSGVDADDIPHRVFLKQSLDETMQPHERLWRYEVEGARVAEHVLRDLVRVPAVIGADAESLLTAFEYMDLMPMDEWLRHDEGAFLEAFDDNMAVIARMLDGLRQVRPGALDHIVPPGSIKTKVRDYRSRGLALGFKGMEIRNLGISRGSPSNAASGEPQGPVVTAFDFGRPYFCPVEEAGAKMLVSVGLLNWGFPLRRFAKGPDHFLLDTALGHLRPLVNAEAVTEELALQRRFRTVEIHGRVGAQRSLRRFGIVTLGKRYMTELEEWAAGAL